MWRGILFKLADGSRGPYCGNDEAAAKGEFVEMGKLVVCGWWVVVGGVWVDGWLWGRDLRPFVAWLSGPWALAEDTSLCGPG